jgi:hypothetical protein
VDAPHHEQIPAFRTAERPSKGRLTNHHTKPKGDALGFVKYSKSCDAYSLALRIFTELYRIVKSNNPTKPSFSVQNRSKTVSMDEIPPHRHPLRPDPHER